MKTFTLSDKQQERANLWLKYHWKVIHKDVSPNDMTGFVAEFVFGPTGMGDNVRMQCVWCKQNSKHRQCHLTIDEEVSGDFIHNYDESWNEIKTK